MPLAKAYNFLTTKNWQNHWWLTLFLKMGLACLIPFFSDEAYYWVWAKNLQISYLDHPPFVAWLFWIGQFFDNYGTASRIPFVILSHLTIWIWCHELADRLTEDRKILLHWVLLLHPLTGLGGLVANPDVPFLFFWSLAIVLYLKCLHHIQSKLYPVFLGICLGLAFCSKYLIALILPVIAIHLTLSQRWKSIPISTFVMTFLFGLIFSLPVLFWNYQNDWISIQFQLQHGLGQKIWNPRWTVDFLLGTLVLLYPPFVFLLIKAKFWKNFEIHSVVFTSLFLFFLYTSLKGDTELNWPIMLYPSFFLILLQQNFTSKKLIGSYVFLYAAISIFLIGGTVGAWGQNLHGRLNEGVKIKKIYQQSESFRPLYLSTYQNASYFWFISKTPFYKLQSSSRPDFFDTLSGSQPKESVFFFMKEQYQTIPSFFLKDHDFNKIKDLEYNYEVYRVTKKP